MATRTWPTTEELLADAWLYAMGITDNARRRLTDQDLAEQPSREPRGFDNFPLNRLANWYLREADTDNGFVLSVRKEKHPTPAQRRGVVNVMLGAYKRGERWPWLVTL